MSQLLRDAEAFIQDNKDEVFGSTYKASPDPFPKGAHIERAVIGVPATYTEAQRAATRRAALQHTTLKEVHLLTESTAAALSYGLMAAGDKVVGVFDMGGGTLDVTLMKVADTGACQVVATAGHPNVSVINY
jgi:molecular chaperone DnaK (HSP70)